MTKKDLVAKLKYKSLINIFKKTEEMSLFTLLLKKKQKKKMFRQKDKKAETKNKQTHSSWI